MVPSSLHTTKPKKNAIVICSILHTSQNKDYVILFMYDKFNTITCLEYRAKLVMFLYKIIHMYLKNLNFLKMGSCLGNQILVQFW